MLILDVNKISKSFGYGQLFEDVSFSLNEGESISIVGPNGGGKSTLLKIIAGLERFDAGSVNIKKGASVVYLDQTASSIVDDRRVYDILKDAFYELNEIENRLKVLENKLKAQDKEYDKILQRYCDLTEKFANLGGYDIDVNIKTICNGLKIDSLIYNSYNDLSGGEKTLVQLAKALLRKPNLFLLDEPTNHLDIGRIEWLEEYITSYKGASIVVSHDRYFLDRISTKILSLEFGKAKVYNTNYTGYLEERKKDYDKQMTDYKLQKDTISRLETQMKYFAQRGMATNSSTLCDRAHAIQSQIERIKKNLIEKPKEQKKLNVDFEVERKSSKIIIEVEGLKVSVSKDKDILKDINITICQGERVAILGANGSGKTTFIKTIMGLQDLIVTGNVKVGPSVKIGYLPQVIEFKDGNQSLLDYFKEQTNINEEKARSILASFQFYREDVNKKVKNLSGGEKLRLKLCVLLQEKINTLIFDEPTNHIDIPTKEVLEEALEDFKGTLIFISHDRFFINKFADKIIEFENGHNKIYIGNYDYYKEKKI